MDTPDWAAGTAVENYVVIRELGRGGMGTVYLARDQLLGRKVALKRISTTRASDARGVQAFLDEARLTARVTHPHVVTVYAVGFADGAPWLALELVDGTTLREASERAEPSPLQAARWMADVARGVAAAHDVGVIHLDLKPNNVLLGVDGRLRVADFGLASLASDDARSTGGTPPYMAPETWRGAEPRPPADVWALGVMLHELITGRRPFAAHEVQTSLLRDHVLSGPPVEVPDVPGLPPRLRQLTAACLARDPAERPTARAVADALDAVLARRTARPDDDRPPFPGLRPLEDDDVLLGRGPDVARAVSRLETEGQLVFAGATGSGKSSLVRAGVVPRLREQGGWVFVVVRPGAEPLAALLSAIRPHLAPSTWSASAPATTFETVDSLSELPVQAPVDEETEPGPGPWALHLMLLQLAREQDCRVLLVVDQFEEIFTLATDPAQRDHVLSLLARVADAPEEPVRAVFTIRDDYLVRMARAFGRAPSLVLVAPPARDLLVEDLRASLGGTGATWEDDALPGELVDHTAASAAPLVLLQFAASQLWDRRDLDRRVLTRRALSDIGGVQGALAQHAEEVVNRFSSRGRRVARALFLRLVHGDGTARPLARDALLDGLPTEAPGILEDLVGARLLVVERRGDHPWVTLVHEALVRSWSRLQEWIADSDAALQTLRRLERAAGEWRERGRPPQGLWTGDELAVARAGVASLGDQPLPSQVQAFVDASARHDLALRRRRQRLGIAALVVALAVTLISLGAARRFDQQRRRAEAASVLAEQRAARAMAATALSEVTSGQLHLARAHVRASLTTADSVLGRAAWARANAAYNQLHDTLPSGARARMPLPGDRLLAGGADGQLGVYDLALGRFQVATHYDGPVRGLAPLGAEGAVVTLEDGRTYRYSLGEADPGPLIREGDTLFMLSGAGSRVVGVVPGFEQKQGTLVVFEADGSVREQTLPVPLAAIQVVADGRRALVMDGVDGATLLVNLDDPEASVEPFGGEREGRAWGFAEAPDGSSAAVIGTRVVVADPLTNVRIAHADGPGLFGAATYLDPETLLFVSSRRIDTWTLPDLAHGEPMLANEVPRAYQGWPTDSGRLLLTGPDDVWVLAHPYRGSRSTSLHADPIDVIAFLGSGMVVSGSQGKVVLSHSEDGSRYLTNNLKTGGRREVAVSHDGARLAITVSSGVRILDGQLATLDQIDLQGQTPTALHFEGPGELYAAGNTEVRAGIDASGRVARHEITRPANAVGTSHHASGVTVIVGTNGSVRVQSRPGGPWSLVHTLNGRPLTAQVSPDGSAVVVVPEAGVPVVVGGTEVVSLDDARARTPALWRTDGSLWYIDDQDWLVERVVEGGSTRLARVTPGVSAMGLSPDGSHLVTGDRFGVVRSLTVEGWTPDWRGDLLDRHGDVRCEASEPHGVRVVRAGEVVAVADLGRDDVVRASGAGCAVLAAGAMGWVGGPTVPGAWDRLVGGDAKHILAMDGDRVAWVDARGQVIREAVLDGGVRAVLEVDGRLWTGDAEGQLALWGDGGRRDLGDAGGLRAPVTRLASPFPGVVVSGTAAGVVGVWSQEDRTRLSQSASRGAIVSVARDGDVMVVTTDLGDEVEVPMWAYALDGCALLEDVYARVYATYGPDGLSREEPELPARCRR